MTQAIKYEISGLKCDAAGCDYHDDEAKFEEYEKYLNAPCPQCGANLLTEADLAATKAIVAGADWINQVIGDVPKGEKRARIRMDMDGSGIPKPRVLGNKEQGWRI